MLLAEGNELARRIIGVRGQRHRNSAATGHRLRPQAHQKLMVRNAEQIGLEARTPFVAVDRLNTGEQRALNQLVDVRVHPAREIALQHRHVAPQQAIARNPVARAPVANQAELGGLFGIHACVARSATIAHPYNVPL
jgi:hypothetical protein